MKNLKNNTLGVALLVVGLLVVMIGITYAVVLVYDGIEGVENNQLVLGDIYMHYNETNQLMLENAMPSLGPDESKYFEFTVSGKNTYTEKDIYYEIVLNHGDNHATRVTRIRDDLLKFRLVEIKDNTETIVLDNETYNSLSNQRIWVNTIEKNTTNDVEITYRLYMWIDYNTAIGSGMDADYDFDTWNNDVYGSIKVEVKGDFKEKVAKVNNSEDFKLYALFEKTGTTITDTDGTIYLSGSKEIIDYNYVWYSGKLWRITAIYPDGTMKMITDDLMTSINWGSDKIYEKSWVREWLNQEFLPTLNNYENIIVEDAGWYSISDSNTPKKPTGEYTLTDPIGLLNSYEYYMSYKNTSYSNGYLNIGYYWWLITPYNSNVRVVRDDYLWDNGPSTSGYGVRPSAKLKSTIQLSGGEGTKSNPYKIKGEQEEAKANITLINTRQSGEYVKLVDEETAPTFRIVDTELVGEKLTTKIVLNDYVKDTQDTDADGNTTEVLTKNFSSSNSYELWTEVDKTNTTYWRGYLNNTWLSSIDNTYNLETGISNILEKGIYYLGYHTIESYKTTVCSAVSSDVSIDECIENETIVSDTSSDDYVGLLRVGEMFATQTRDYTSSTVSYYWLITPYGSSTVCGVDQIDNSSGGRSPAYPEGARPSINLKSTIVIKSGSGTEQDPFVVGLPN